MLLKGILFNTGSYFVGSCEKNAIHSFVNTQSAPDFFFSLNQIKYSGWNPGFLKTLRHNLANHRSFFRRLENHRVACQKRWDNMPVRKMPWEVEWADHRHDS